MSTTQERRKRKLKRLQRNKNKQEKLQHDAIKKGHIIKEEHGQKLYSTGFIHNAYRQIMEKIWRNKNGDRYNYSKEAEADLFKRIRKYKDIILDLIIYWPRYHEEWVPYLYEEPLGLHFFNSFQTVIEEYYYYLNNGRFKNGRQLYNLF